MSTAATLNFCINHSSLLDSKNSKIFEINFVNKINLIKPQLELFLDYYKTYTEHSVIEYKKSSQDIYTKDLVLKLSQFLNLSCDVSSNLLCNYLNVEEQTHTDNSELKLTRGYDSISLIRAVHQYYHNERLSLIRMTRYLFCSRKDSWKTISNIIKKTSTQNERSFLNRIIHSFESKLNEILAFKLSEEFSEDKFAIYSLEEQVVLLETLLLAVYSMKDSLDSQTFEYIIKVFQNSILSTSEYGSRSYSSKASIKSFLDRIGFLKGLILIQTARLDRLVGCSDNFQNHFLIQGDNLLKLSALSCRLGSHPCDAACMLLTSLLRTIFHSSDAVTAKLADDAVVKLGLFKYINATIKSRLYSITSTNCSHLELVVHSVLFDLLSFWCQNVHIQSLDEALRQDLVNVLCELVQPLQTYTDLKLFDSGFSKMLEDVSFNFPVNLEMLKVISSLMNKVDVDEQVNDKVVEILSSYLDNLSSFCDDRTEEGNYVVDNVDDDNNGKCVHSCRLIAPYFPYGKLNEKKLLLEKGQEGFLYGNVVVWAVRYSAWDVVLWELELNCKLIVNGNDIFTRFQRLQTILEFMSTCFKNNVQKDLTIFTLCNLLPLIDNRQLLLNGCEGVLEQLIYISGQVLATTSDHAVIRRIVSTTNLFPNSYSSSERLISSDSIIFQAWQNLSVSSNVSIVKAYLLFSIQLINSEKFMIGEFGVIPSSIIFGSIFFVTSNLLVNVKNINLPEVSDMVLTGLTFLNDIISLDPSLYTSISDARKCRLELIQRVTLDTIAQNEPTLQTLISISSISVDCLLSQTNVSSQMFLIQGNDEKLSTIVRMSLTIVKSILSQDGLNKVLLNILNSTVNEHSNVNRTKKSHSVTFTHRYVLSLLELLGYPYGVKMARMALIVLKQLVLKTNVSIVACLGEKSSRIKEFLLAFVRSNEKDQVLRGLIFEFFAECVLGGRHGILQLIFGNNNDVNENIAYKSCLEVIENFQPEDSISMVLLVSVTKFLNAIWISDCQIGFMSQKCLKMWSSLLPPLKYCLGVIKSQNSLDIFLYDYIGNVFGLFAMEIYSRGVVTQDDEIVKSLNNLCHQGMIVEYLEVFNKTSLHNDKLNLKIFFDKILTSTTWWKTLIFTTLSIDSDSGIVWLSSHEEHQLLQKIIFSIDNLILFYKDNCLDTIVSITDILVSCVLNIINKKIKIFSDEEAEDILNGIYNFMKAALSTNCFRSQLYHADLLACCSLLLQEHSINTNLLEKYSHLSEDLILMFTSKSSINKIDTKVLVHAFTTHMSINKDLLGSSVWISNVVENSTLVNCISLLDDMVKSGDLSILTQSILTFLIRVCSNEHGARRVLQSSLVSVMEIDLSSYNYSDDIVSYLTLTTRLATTLVQQCGTAGHAITFRFISAHWELLQSLIMKSCERMASKMSSVDEYKNVTLTLKVATSLFDLLWHLSSVKNTWVMFWPCSMVSSIMLLVTSSLNILISVLNDPQTTFVSESAFILRVNSRSLRNTPSFSITSPRKNSPSVTFCEENPIITNKALELASAGLEDVIYRLLYSSVKLYSRSTYIISEEHIYEGFDYSSKLLSCSFEEPTFNKRSEHLSFGSLFSLLSSTQNILRDNLPSLTFENEKVFIERELIRQMHEIILGTIVSHSIIYLTKFDQSQKTQRNNFILELKSELNCYLDGLSKSRRRNMLSSSSPISYGGPRVTSTPCFFRSPSIGESLEAFCLTVDSFKKSLDL